ncbi:MAG: hypothetical protein P8M70_11550 [Verrucomicrobiota bacterium]|nr:hypothetical protein [Verrucomicrobiota bacterium]
MLFVAGVPVDTQKDGKTRKRNIPPVLRQEESVKIAAALWAAIGVRADGFVALRALSHGHAPTLPPRTRMASLNLLGLKVLSWASDCEDCSGGGT